MAKITQEMKEMCEKSRPWVFATASKDGKPNNVPIAIGSVLSDDEVMLADNFMQKTRDNLAENPWTAFTFWNMEARYGYQFKGKARVEESGANLDAMKAQMANMKMPFSPKAVVIIKVEEIYYVGSGKDSTVRLDQQG